MCPASKPQTQQREGMLGVRHLGASVGEQRRQHLAEAGLAEGVAAAEDAREGPRLGVLLEADRAEVRLRDRLRNLPRPKL